MKNLKIGCVVMAAGLSSRFGRNKLLAEWDGRSLINRALDAVPPDSLYRTVVVTRFPEAQALAEARNFETVWNDNPEDGISRSLQLGLGRLSDADAVMFMVCDQPLLTLTSVKRLVDFYREHPVNIVRMAYGEERGNPCVFPSAFFPELDALRGDTGGGAVIRRHEASVLHVEAADASELRDVDQLSDILGQ